jgi:hypothetical protein
VHKPILRKQKNQTSASEWDAGGIQACSRWSSVSDTTRFCAPPHGTPAGVQAARPPEESLPKRNFMQPLSSKQLCWHPFRMLKLGEVYRWWRCRSTDRLQAGMPQASSNNPLHRQQALTTTHSRDLPMRWFFALGLGGRIRPSAARGKEGMSPALTTPRSWSGGT